MNNIRFTTRIKEGQVNAGDYVRCLEVDEDATDDLTVGRFYKVVATDGDTMTILDDAGDEWPVSLDDDSDGIFELARNRKISDVQLGDFVLDTFGRKRRVQAVAGELFGFSAPGDFEEHDGWLSFQEAEGWRIEEETEEELTMDEVCKRLGKRVKIVKGNN